MTALISDDEINDIIKIVKPPEEFCLLITGVSETIKNETKKLKGRLLGMLLGTLAASLLGNILVGKVVKGGDGFIQAGEGAIATSQGRATNKVGQDF